MNLIARAEHALAEFKAGRVNHWLHAELADLVAEFHKLVTSEAKAKPSPADDSKSVTPSK